jgi:tetratricopeptide (TPR) repeat protein
VALQRFDAALTIDPRNPDSYYNKGALLHRSGLATGDKNALTQAESLYRQCLDYNTDHVDCHRGLAVLLTETDRVPQAFELLQGWAARSPQNADARVELARLYEEYNDRRLAEQYLNESLAVAPGNFRAHAALGRLKEQAGDVSQALVNYERSYNLNRFQPQLATRIETLRNSPGAAGGTTLAGRGSPLAAPRTAAAPRDFRTY